MGAKGWAGLEDALHGNSEPELGHRFGNWGWCVQGQDGEKQEADAGVTVALGLRCRGICCLSLSPAHPAGHLHSVPGVDAGMVSCAAFPKEKALETSCSASPFLIVLLRLPQDQRAWESFLAVLPHRSVWQGVNYCWISQCVWLP